jgi:hypothetical protein
MQIPFALKLSLSLSLQELLSFENISKKAKEDFISQERFKTNLLTTLKAS